jgi:dephospho-CoA kinase
VRVISVVGMAGAGKSEVAKVFEENGYIKIRFGDVTDEEIKRRGLVQNEENERHVREDLREKCGMDIYAQLNLPKIESALKQADVVVDGLYSWEEYKFLKDSYKDDLHVVSVYASPETRHQRLTTRASRALTLEEAIGRDREEIEEINKGGPIAMADFTIINESSLENLRNEVNKVISKLKGMSRSKEIPKSL